MGKDLILLIGGGNMGLAIASGIAKQHKELKSRILISEKKKERLIYIKKAGFKVFKNHIDVLTKYKHNIKVIILAVKPSELDSVLSETSKIIYKRAVIISILAGTTIKKLSSRLPLHQPICRIMPNTPAKIGEGISAITFNRYLNKKQKDFIKDIFESVGKTVEIAEKHFDLITAISGSGPAYFCYFMECLIKAAKKHGLSDTTAKKLVIQTSFGSSALLLRDTMLNPELLRQMVTSPKGTTEAALNVFKNRGFYTIIERAVGKAKQRAKELSKL